MLRLFHHLRRSNSFPAKKKWPLVGLAGMTVWVRLGGRKRAMLKTCASSVDTPILRHLALEIWGRRIHMDVETIFISMLRLRDDTVSFSLPGLSNQQHASAVLNTPTEKHPDNHIVSQSDHRLSNLSLSLPRPSQRPLPRKICFIRATIAKTIPMGNLTHQ